MALVQRISVNFELSLNDLLKEQSTVN